MNLARRRLWTNAFPTEALCTRSLERYRAPIGVQRQPLAVASLRRIASAPLRLSNKQGASALRRLGEVAAAATELLKILSQALSTPRQTANR